MENDQIGIKNIKICASFKGGKKLIKEAKKHIFANYSIKVQKNVRSSNLEQKTEALQITIIY